jgi:hypothetical protein
MSSDRRIFATKCAAATAAAPKTAPKEDAQDANLGTQMSRVGRDRAERRGARLEEQGVEARAVPKGQGQQAMREREDDVHVGHLEQLALARVQPALPRLRLALRAVPVPTANGELTITCLMVSARFWGVQARSRSRTVDNRPIWCAVYSP